MTNFISTMEAAKILGISPIAVFKQIRSGKIKAKKVGHGFVIEKSELLSAMDSALGKSQKDDIKKAVRKTASHYGKKLKRQY